MPPSLQAAVCEHIHGAHQGVSQVMNRAAMSVFWPGLTKDIQDTRQRCQTCHTIALSHPYLAASEPFVTVLPSQAVTTDYFKLKGNKYFLTVDLFTNWLGRGQDTTATVDADTTDLIKALRQILARLVCQNICPVTVAPNTFREK